MRLSVLAVAAILAAVAGARAGDDTQNTIQAVKEFQESLGLARTGNFQHVSEKEAAAYRCYYAGKLELPASYDELRFEKGAKEGCRIDHSRYDVFFYPIEAVASGSTPVTASLAAASTERMLMVVSHEDLHQFDREHLPSAATEAASTLMGFIASAEFARGRLGETSPVYLKLAADVDLFLQKALVVNAYQAKVSSLYESFRSGSLSRDAALEEKRRLFGQLESACRAIAGIPSSFNKCPAAINNAGLAFDFTYTRHYPLLHRLFVSRDRDLRSTLSALQEIMRLPLKTEEDFVAAATARISAGD